METYKTFDGVAVDNETIMMVTMALSDCSLKRLEELEMQSFFFGLAIKFIGAITKEQLEEFLSHPAAMCVIKLIQL